MARYPVSAAEEALFGPFGAPEITRQCVSCSRVKPLKSFQGKSGGYRGWTCTRCVTLWTDYRLRYRHFKELLEKFDGCCHACKRPFAEEPHVDHLHASGRTSCAHRTRRYQSCRDCVRGLLCNPCNSVCGWIEAGTDVQGCEKYLASTSVGRRYDAGRWRET